MKAEFDKEMDSLLRQSARRGRASFGGARAPVFSAHLDADEQSAYAENALPAAARALYTAHLADCDDCRRSVTQLALAAGTAAQLNARETATATAQAISPQVNWRERLGALFAPRAWRYAVPALALLLVGAISLIVLTGKKESETSLARRSPTEVQKSPQATQTEAHHAPQNGNVASTNAPGQSGTVAPDPNAPASNSNASAAREEIAAARSDAPTKDAPTVAPVAPVAATADAPPPPVPAAGSSGEVARVFQESATPVPTPAPLADAAIIASEQEAKTRSGAPAPELRKLEQRSGDFENRQYENRQRERLSGPRRNEQTQNRRPPAANDASDRAERRDEDLAATTAAPSSPTARRSARREAERNKDENRSGEDSGGRAGAARMSVETRTVAGRRFRRQGDAWVDTAYAAGQSYTLVRRNSEQFRALAADEPQLRRIADALGGEVTVVWKGRAYRFR